MDQKEKKTGSEIKKEIKELSKKSMEYPAPETQNRPASAENPLGVEIQPKKEVEKK